MKLNGEGLNWKKNQSNRGCKTKQITIKKLRTTFDTKTKWHDIF
jgi:hypothetical protein